MATHVDEAAPSVRRVAEAKVYIWSFPGSPIEVHIDLDLVDRIRLQSSAGHPKPGGVLLGRVEGNIIYLNSVNTLAAVDHASVEGALKEQDVNTSTVGFYRLDSGEMLRLSAHDIELAKRFFPPPSSIILLIRSGNTGVPTAGMFFWEAGQLYGDFAFLEFPFDSALLAIEHGQKARCDVTARSADRNATDAGWGGRLDAPPRAVIEKQKIAAWIAGALVLAGVSAVSMWNLPRWHFGNRPSSPPASAAARFRPRIDLRAERAGQDFRLTWALNSPVVRSAVSGLLSIQDARGRKEILLQPNELRSGSVLYQPYGEQIQVQLSLLSIDRIVATDSVTMVLPPGGAPVLSVVSPAWVRRGSPIAETNSSVVPARPGKKLEKAQVEQVPPTKLDSKAGLSSDPAVFESIPPAHSSQIEESASISTTGFREATNTKVSASLSLELPQIQTTPVPSDLTVPLPSATAAPAPPAAVPGQPVPTRALNYTPPVVSSQVVPRVDAAIRSMLINTVEVEVKLQIDTLGRVVNAEPAQPLKGFNQHLGRAAVEAALRWKYIPARMNGKVVPSVQNVKFVFQK